MTEPSQYFKGRTVQEQMNEVIGYVDTRAAEVATTAIASDVAQVHQDMLDADADAQAAAASAAAAAGTLANAVKKTGESSQSIAGDIAVAGDLTGGTVTVPTPVNNTDAANKKYVDDKDALDVKISGINNYALGLSGNQEFSGDKVGYGGVVKYKATSHNIDQGNIDPNGFSMEIGRGIDMNGVTLYQDNIAKTASLSRYKQTIIRAVLPNNDAVVMYVNYEIDVNGVCRCVVIRTVNGTETGRTTIFTLS